MLKKCKVCSNSECINEHLHQYEGYSIWTGRLFGLNLGYKIYIFDEKLNRLFNIRTIIGGFSDEADAFRRAKNFIVEKPDLLQFFYSKKLKIYYKIAGKT